MSKRKIQPQKKRIEARATVRTDRHRNRLNEGKRARVPFEVCQKLRAAVGDEIVFEEGCDAAHQKAMGKPYFIVRREVLHPLQVPAAKPMKPIADDVQRKLDERTGRK